MMAGDGRVPVVPVSISVSVRVMPKGKLRVFPGTIRVTIHEPISTEGYSRSNVLELVGRVRATVLSAIAHDAVT